MISLHEAEPHFADLDAMDAGDEVAAARLYGAAAKRGLHPDSFVKNLRAARRKAGVVTPMGGGLYGRGVVLDEADGVPIELVVEDEADEAADFAEKYQRAIDGGYEDEDGEGEA